MEEEKQSGNMWDQLGAGSYSALNAGLMGLPDFLVEKVGGSKTYDELQKYRAQNKMASDIGGAVGTVGSMFIPGGAITKLAGLGAKAVTGGKLGGSLVKAGEALSRPAEGLLGNVVKAGGQALEQSALRNTFDVTKNEDGTEKDLSQRLGNIAGETALGAGLGGLAGTALSKLTGAAKSSKNLSTKDFLTGELEDRAAAAGLMSKGFTKSDASKVLRLQGIKKVEGDKVERQMQKWDDLANKYGLTDSAQAQDNFTVGYRNDWKQITGVAETASPKQVTKILKSINIPNISKTSIMDARNDLVGEISKYRMATDSAGIQKLDELIAAKNKLDDEISNLAEKSGLLKQYIPEKMTPKEFIAASKEKKILNDLVEANRGTSALQGMADDSSLGSNTALKTALDNLAKPGMSTAAGAGLGYASGETDEEKMRNALLGGVGATVGGSALQKLLGKTSSMINKGVAKEVSDKLTPEAIQKLATKGEQAVETLGKSPLATIGNKTTLGELIPETIAKTPAALSDSGGVEEEAAKTKVITDPKYQATIQTNLEQLYNTYYSDMDPQVFMDKIKAKTNNFDPLNDNTAIVLFGGDKQMGQQYLKDVNSLSSLKSYKKEGLDIPFLGTNKNDKAALQSLTDIFTRDTGDIATAEKEAKKWLKLLKDGKVTTDQLTTYLQQDKLKHLQDIGVMV